jgi:hypothetical protein
MLVDGKINPRYFIVISQFPCKKEGYVWVDGGILNTLFFNKDGSLSESLAARPVAAALDVNGFAERAARAAAAEPYELIISRRDRRFMGSFRDNALSCDVLINRSNKTWLNPIIGRKGGREKERK